MIHDEGCDAYIYVYIYRDRDRDHDRDRDRDRPVIVKLVQDLDGMRTHAFAAGIHSAPQNNTIMCIRDHSTSTVHIYIIQNKYNTMYTGPQDDHNI